ncbi:MAG: hypothetical protein ACRCYU_06930 [Nocardioides sp.]
MGFNFTFEDGLNVLRADNSSGKSTVLQSIIYALGLEGMLSARRDIPLPHSMTDYVEVDGETLSVITSAVVLEVENGSGEIISIERSVKNSAVSQQLVQVTFGPMLTSLGQQYPRRDYFVRRSGAAQREAGFHRFLAEWVGWQLPVVTRMDGSEGPLYLECLFPYFYVEQKHGWSGVHARIPTYLGIRDVAKRSPEYLLSLEVFQRILARQRLRSARGIIEAEWQSELAAYARTADGAGAVISRLPERISASLEASSAQPQLYVGDSWRDVDQALDLLRTEISRLEAEGTPTVGEAAEELEQQLVEKQAALDRILGGHAAVSEELAEYERRRDQLALRIESLKEDLQRHKDSVVLERLGSSQSLSMLAERVCPTCHKELDDGSMVSAHVMTKADNIKFIEQQLVTFTAMLRDAKRVAGALANRKESLRQSSRQARSEIRALRDSLSSRSATPSLATVNALVATRLRLERLEDRHQQLIRHRSQLQAIHASWAENRERFGGLTDEGLTASDEATLADLERQLRSQLARYHFSSLPPESVDINRETYRPAHEGFDLGFDLSASDMIRVIWAYLISFMHASRGHGGNHPGFLIFDEPRQQETAKDSYRELLQQSAEEARAGAQILIATSETSLSLREMLGSAKYHLFDQAEGKKLLQEVAQSGSR